MIIIKVLIVVIIFKLIAATSTIIIVTDRYSKLIRSSCKYCFLIVHSVKKMLFNSVFVRVDVFCYF